jgi:membrane protein DedA with SNARE-associated domain
MSDLNVGKTLDVVMQILTVLIWSWVLITLGSLLLSEWVAEERNLLLVKGVVVLVVETKVFEVLD